MQCRRAVGPSWGFKPATMRWIYEVMVRPILSYGATIWINGARTQHNQQLLNGVQRLANVLITGAMPSTPGAALDVITGNIPITYWLEEEAAKGALRLQSLGHWQHPPPGKSSVRLTSHIWANEKLIKPIPREITSQSQEQTTPCLSIDQGFTVDIPTKDDFMEPNEAEYDVNCYTDGSKINALSSAGKWLSETLTQLTLITRNPSILASTVQSSGWGDGSGKASCFLLRWYDHCQNDPKHFGYEDNALTDQREGLPTRVRQVSNSRFHDVYATQC